MLRRTASGISPRHTTSETANLRFGRSTRNASFRTRLLSADRIDDAIRDDDVYGRGRQRDVFDFALEELDIRRARLCLIRTRASASISSVISSP